MSRSSERYEALKRQLTESQLEALKDEIVERYAAGETGPALGEEVGVSAATIGRWAIERGVRVGQGGRSGRPRIAPDVRKQMIEMRPTHTVPEIAKALGVCPDTVRSHTAGVDGPRRRPSKGTPANMAKALELHEAGVRLSTIGEELGVSKAHVSRLVKQAREQGAGSSMSEIDKSLMSAIKWTERHRDVLEWAVDQALAIKASGARVPMNALHEAAMERAPEMRCSRGAFEMAVRRRMGVSDE